MLDQFGSIEIAGEATEMIKMLSGILVGLRKSAKVVKIN